MSEEPRSERPPADRIHDVPRILDAMRMTLREVVRRHKQLGLPLAVWRDGRVVWVPADEVPED